MGVDTRKPLLPAPTESSTLDTAGESVTGTDLATDISRRTDKTSYSIPEDGSPIVISTRRKSSSGDKHDRKGHHSHQSQTSLLIEYFEGGKSGPDVRSRPSVRVKVTPSAAKKLKDSHDHIQISETVGNRKPSHIRRISLGKAGVPAGITEGDDHSVSSYISAEEDSNLASRGPPIDIEVHHRDHGSDLSGTSFSRDRYIEPTSDISSMPADSMLEETRVETTESPKHDRSHTLGKAVAAGIGGAALATIAKDHLKTPSRRRSRSPSTERITQKVMEKLNHPRDSGSGRRHSDKSRSRSVSKEHLETEIKSPRRRSGRHREEELTSAESSLLSSNLSPHVRRKSGDQMSFRSGTSKSSLNNPKLLDTVEDAIRRLILPELKELKKDQKVQQNRNKFEQDQSTLSGSSVSKGDVTRKVSKHSSMPDVHKSKFSRDDRDYDVLSSGDSVKRRRERRKDQAYDSPSDRSYDRRTSESTVVDDEKVSRKKSKDGHRLRDAGAGALVGGILTAAALKHHEKSGEKERRRKRRSKSRSRSRSASIAGSDEIFHKHDVPPMPMRSDIDSELTRDSLISERTVEPSTPGRGPEVREVIRGSPREMLSPAPRTPASRTPTRTPVGLQKGLGTLHENVHPEDRSVHSVETESDMYRDEEYDHPDDEQHNSAALKGGLAGAAAGVGVLAAGHLLDRHRDQESYSPGAYVHGRGLSPIQSVASYQEEGYDEPPNRDSTNRPASTRSLSSPTKYEAERGDKLSIGSLSSAASTKMARSRRPHGITLENPSEILAPHDLPRDDLDYDQSPREANMDQWYDEQHRENDRYRNSAGGESLDDPRVDVKRMTNYTDDSMDAPYLDQVTDGQQILGIGANPEYRHTPIAVESAVASLHDPSVASIQSNQSPSRSYPSSPNRQYTRSVGSFEGSDKGFIVSEKGSPLKHRIDAADIPDKSFHGRMGATSPPQSVTRSLDEAEDHVPLGASAVPIAEDPIPEIGYRRESSHESDINTNPSIIQGTMGGVGNENRDHWPYNPTPPRSKGLMSPHSDKSGRSGVNPVEAGLLGAAAGAGLGALAGHKLSSHDKGHERDIEDGEYDTGVNHDFAPQRDVYTTGQTIPTPPGAKDEGYISAAPAKSPGALTPEPRHKGVPMLDNPEYDDDTATEDPFTGATHTRHLSGFSQGMPSPLYDGATGRGIDRIQSKDIVALMDHLTVRDAQRNARDTEILVTLVRSAAEMRNSFEDMKRFIAEQDDLIMDEADRQHEDTRKALSGPRPQPAGASPKYGQRAVGDAALDDIQTKRKNVFRRALKGLSKKSSNDLGKIEEMLVQLLGDVEGLKAGQTMQPQGLGTKSSSLDSINNPREVNQDGYEPEGQAGTSSTGNQSGYLSTHSSRPPGDTRAFSGRKSSANRVSTVLEGDEEPDENDDTVLYGDQMSNLEDYEDRLATPTQELERGGSVPLATPPRAQVPTGAHSNENTPRTNTDKSRKHKSSSSSFFPKISRWSKTTASSVGENIRQSVQRKERPYSEVSHSGSDLNYQTYDNYDAHGNDKLRSAHSLEGDEYLPAGQENRPPSPLVPSQVSDHPKYQAHRNSLNLQHPQPRQGPTGRYQSHLESQAQNFGDPISPTSDQWGSNPQLQPVNTNRHSYSSQPGHLSPISDGGYSDASSTAPPRPPKVKDEGPLIPQRPAKVKEGQSPVTYADHVAVARMGASHSSPIRSASGQTPPSRKPTGPRPITTSGQYSPDKISQLQRQRYRGSPNHIDSSNENLTF